MNKSKQDNLQLQLDLVSAPEDFPPKLRSLITLDSTLRCPICKEFYQAPVLIHIPKCCHTFCSACIRTCFNNNSNNQKIKATGLGGVGNSHRCPICKVEAQEEKIKPVPTLESAVVCWQEAREEIFNIINRLQSFESNSNKQQEPFNDHPPSFKNHPVSSSSTTSTRPNTRSTQTTASNTPQQASSKQKIPSIFASRPDSKDSKTRSSNASTKRKLTNQSLGHDHSDDDIQLLSYNPSDPSAPVECPLCSKQMLNSIMDAHITRCLNNQKKDEYRPTPSSPNPRGKRLKNNFQKQPDHQGSKPNQTRIPLPHFSSLKPHQIKAELARHSLDLTGTPSDQIRRLSKYITLFNANLDAQLNLQKSIECIKTQVSDWENLQDDENLKLDYQHKKILSNHRDYLKSNKSHFDLLIQQASKSIKKPSNSNHLKPKSGPEVDNQDQPQEIRKEDASNKESSGVVLVEPNCSQTLINIDDDAKSSSDSNDRSCGNENDQTMSAFKPSNTHNDTHIIVDSSHESD